MDVGLVAAQQGDRPERGGQSGGGALLARPAHAHRSARVHEQREREPAILDADLDDQLVQAPVDAPVDPPQLVACHVRAVVGELEPRNACAALPLSDEAGDDRGQRREVEPLELAQQLGVEQRGGPRSRGVLRHLVHDSTETMSSVETPLRSASKVRIRR